VIIDEEGYLLTNDHVVGRASRIWVRLHDGREFEADRVATGGANDVALLKLRTSKKEHFPSVKMARADDLLLGETVLALGNPFGLGGSVSRGILSSKARRAAKENEPLNIADWLQTDAAINPGNSGGPLINLRGELIGLNVAIYREGQGIGFAIPIKRVQEALTDLLSPESMKSLWFGARLKEYASPLVVNSVQAGSPAAKAGLRPDDIILQINNRRPSDLLAFNSELLAAGTQKDIVLSIQRGPERRNLSLRLAPESSFFNADLIRRRTGILLQKMTPQLAERFGLRSADGFVIAGVDGNSPAAQAQLEPGILVEAIDGHRVSSVTEAAKLIHPKKKGDEVVLSLNLYRRRGNLVFNQPADVGIRVQ
jgi:S1-C subfamily serine protease